MKKAARDYRDLTSRIVQGQKRHARLIHIITKDSDSPKHPAPAHALALMLGALARAEADPRGLFEGLCDNFCGPLAARLLRAAGFVVTDDVQRRIR